MLAKYECIIIFPDKYKYITYKKKCFVDPLDFDVPSLLPLPSANIEINV